MKKAIKASFTALTVAGTIFAGAALAQDTAVTLKSLDSSLDVTGDLISSDAQSYVVHTVMGDMTVPRAEVVCTGNGCPAEVPAPVVDAPVAADAADRTVTLKSHDQTLDITGELVSITDGDYVINTVMGEMTIPGEEVSCTGAACAPVVDNSVVLTAGDGTTFRGALKDFDGTNYILDTDVGELTIRGEFVSCEGSSCPADAADAPVDRTVKLTAGDGSVFDGTLNSFDGTNYILDTDRGQLTIRGEFVTCEGAVCPDTSPVAETFTIASPAGVGEKFIGEALSRFVAEKSLNITRSLLDGGKKIQYLVGGNNGTLVADITVIPADDISSIDALFSHNAAFALTREAFTTADVASVTHMAVSDVASLLDSRTIALDALEVEVHSSNRVRAISLTQMAEVLAGKVTNWADLGGDDTPISVHVLKSGSNLDRLIARDILAPRGLTLGANVVVHDTLADLAAAVNGDPNGFAVSYRSEVGDADISTVISSCNMFSSANPFSLQTEEYPLTSRWQLYTLKGQEIPTLASSLAEYLISDQGQSAAKLANLVGLAIDRQPMGAQGERLLSAMLGDTINAQGIAAYRDYLAEVSTADRLSTTLHFVTGSSQLDARAVSDVKRISDLISKGMLDKDNLVLVGFSDSIGSFAGNLRLSSNRADGVKNLLLQDNIGRISTDEIKTFGFGPVAPVGCNVSPEGRQLNRRVEVWVRSATQGKLQ